MADEFDINLEKLIKTTTTFTLDQIGKQWMKVINNEKRERMLRNYINRVFIASTGIGVPAVFIYEMYRTYSGLK